MVENSTPGRATVPVTTAAHRIADRGPRDALPLSRNGITRPAVPAWRKPSRIGAAVAAGVVVLAGMAGCGDARPSATTTVAEETTTTTTVEPPPTTTTTTTTTTMTTTTMTTTTTTPPPPPPKAPKVVAPVTEKPPRTREPAPRSECDPNYSGCVPIASDVDCAGGSGNGPAYVEGPVQVTGNDIYELDRDGDGTACE